MTTTTMLSKQNNDENGDDNEEEDEVSHETLSLGIQIIATSIYINEQLNLEDRTISFYSVVVVVTRLVATMARSPLRELRSRHSV